MSNHQNYRWVAIITLGVFGGLCLWTLSQVAISSWAKSVDAAKRRVAEAQLEREMEKHQQFLDDLNRQVKESAERHRIWMDIHDQMKKDAVGTYPERLERRDEYKRLLDKYGEVVCLKDELEAIEISNRVFEKIRRDGLQYGISRPSGADWNHELVMRGFAIQKRLKELGADGK